MNIIAKSSLSITLSTHCSALLFCNVVESIEIEVEEHAEGVAVDLGGSEFDVEAAFGNEAAVAAVHDGERRDSFRHFYHRFNTRLSISPI